MRIQRDTKQPVNTNELLEWLRRKITEAEKTLGAREEMESAWRTGSDAAWRAAGCDLSRAARLKNAEAQGRIAAHYRRELEMFNATLAALSQPAAQ